MTKWFRGTRKELIEARSIPEPNSGCWLWMNATQSRAKPSHGYGAIRISGKTVRAHRVSYEAHKGEIPDGMCVLHRCDNPSCVNPDHLFLGTMADNNNDRDNKGRTKTNPRHGEEHGMVKLTPEQVLEIRQSPLKQRDTAKQYGVHQAQVHRIKSRKSWKYL